MSKIQVDLEDRILEYWLIFLPNREIPLFLARFREQVYKHFILSISKKWYETDTEYSRLKVTGNLMFLIIL